MTADGRQFYVYAEKLLNLSNEAKEVISSSVSPKGVIELGTAESLCIYRLSDVLIDFRALYPGVEVKIRFDTSDDFYNHLRKNVVDVAIVLDNRCVADDIVTHVLAEEPMVVIAAAGHPLARKKCVLPKDLQGQPLILTEESCSYHEAIGHAIAYDYLCVRVIRWRSFRKCWGDYITLLEQAHVTTLGL